MTKTIHYSSVYVNYFKKIVTNRLIIKLLATVTAVPKLQLR